jgi:hypothetical protein
MSNDQNNSDESTNPVDTLVMLACPFCGEVPEQKTADDVIGTWCEIACDCGMARSGVQISDLMDNDERAELDFVGYMFPLKYRQRALKHCIKKWNTRAT